MSDFREISDFRKGKKTGLQYNDPTYLSFIFMFNWHDKNSSPLLAGAAEDFIKYNLINGNSINITRPSNCIVFFMRDGFNTINIRQFALFFLTI